MTNLFRVLKLWVEVCKMTREIKRSTRYLLQTTGVTVTSAIEKDLVSLVDLRRFYQQQAVRYENLGYPRISAKFLEMKDILKAVESVSQTWLIEDKPKTQITNDFSSNSPKS